MSIYKQGEIALVPFPFSDLSRQKVRPVLILSNNKYNQSSSDILVCGLTTNLKPTSYSVFVTPDDIEGKDKLRHKSKIKVDAIVSLDQKLLIKSIAKLRDELFIQVIDEINKLIKI